MANIMATEPARDAAAVTPSDSTQISPVARALYVGGAGNIKLVTEEGTTVTFQGIVAGSVLPVKTTKVFSTDTTATYIVALF